MESADMLGLLFWFLNTSGRIYSLCPILGLVPSSVSAFVEYSLEVMYRMCCHERSSPLRVRCPNNRPNGHLFKRVFGVVHGFLLPFSDYIDFDAQNSFYEVYTASF